MCGIVGIVHTNPERPVEVQRIRAMCDSMRHRGPDDEGIALGRGAAIAARRLSIIDVEFGHQPIWNEDSTVAIAFNGEVYNHRDVRREAMERGHRFQTACDTEAVLHLAEDYGPQTPAKLRGMFSFAVWNDKRRELLLARDRFGIKPLYYVTGPWGLAFASELKTLVAAGITDRALDWSALDMYFELGYIVAPATPFLDVRKLPPAHTLVWRDGEVYVERYWSLPRASDAPEPSTDEVLEWMDDSVRAHMVSDLPVAAFLSGGLDSSAVLASAAADGAPPHAFTCRYSGSGSAATDETALAAAMAERGGARLTVVDIHADIAGTFDRIIRALDEPLADDSAIPSWFLAERVAAEYKVALTGIGGDELFVGYRRHQAIMALDAWQMVPRPIRGAISGLASLLPEPTGWPAIGRAKRFLDIGERGHASRYLGAVRRLGRDERSWLYGEDPTRGDFTSALRSLGVIATESSPRDSLTAALVQDYRAFLADDVLALADRVSMAHGLELRVPFVDHEMVERIFPLPAHVKATVWQRKRLLSKALKSRLPAEHFRAPKRGFTGPTGAWMRSELRPMLLDLASGDRIRRLGVLNATAVRGLVSDHLNSRRDRETSLWAVLCFLAWHEQYCGSAPTAGYPAAPPIRLQTEADHATATPRSGPALAGR
jgi:asparagine synthase (glutamine-hydrolysing)